MAHERDGNVSALHCHREHSRVFLGCRNDVREEDCLLLVIRLAVGPLAKGPQSEEYIPIDVDSRDLSADLVSHGVYQTEAGCLCEVLGADCALVPLEVGGHQRH